MSPVNADHDVLVTAADGDGVRLEIGDTVMDLTREEAERLAQVLVTAAAFD